MIIVMSVRGNPWGFRGVAGWTKMASTARRRESGNNEHAMQHTQAENSRQPQMPCTWRTRSEPIPRAGMRSCAKLRPVSVSRRQRRAGRALLLALLGAWLSHTAIYLDLQGTDGLRAELVGAPHLYMLPAAALIVAVSGVVAGRWWQLWCDLGRRLVAARSAIEHAWRGHRPASPPPESSLRPPSRSGRLLSLWLAVAPLQLTLYVLQENLEARSMHEAAPGLSLLWADHWTATVIHLVTALLLCAVVLRLRRGVARREHALVLRERLVRWLLRLRPRRLPPPARPSSRPWTGSADSSGAGRPRRCPLAGRLVRRPSLDAARRRPTRPGAPVSSAATR